ncbi:choice-of-anchor W domain-containing protein [Haloglomus litoreum]|uniref:choice-of-anchor W domain-containing protein n=1 Tax=Haloglomus litoreum TaxID=3034026 RepID=UPI0023E7760D|nr:choice-of-anchor W domain-containing protein [Haloglomus sp. DT116]
MSNNDDINPESTLYTLSRRKVLAGMGAVGLASAGAGLGTSALFSDTESFNNNVLTAGTLNLLVDYYSYWDQDIRGMGTVSGTADGPAVTAMLDDMKPGDEGLLAFCFRIDDNPAYIWLCGELVENAENGQNEAEENHSDDTSLDIGELADSIVVDVDYCDVAEDLDANGTDGFDPGDVSKIADVFDGTLAEFLALVNTGVPLDGDASGGVLAPGDQAPFDGLREEEIDNPCLCIEWEIPIEVGNEIQSDSLVFDLEFYAEQARNNDGTNNPCAPSITTRTGEGFAKQQEFGGGVEASFARGRYGNNAPPAPFEVGIGLPGSPTPNWQDQANYVWDSGVTVPFSYSQDGAGNGSFTLDGVMVSSGALPPANGKVAITTKADEATIDVANLVLELDGTPVSLSGPDAISASNDGSGREVTYLVFDTNVGDLANGFEVSGDVTVTLQGDYSGSDEDVAFDISVE